MKRALLFNLREEPTKKTRTQCFLNCSIRQHFIPRSYSKNLEYEKMLLMHLHFGSAVRGFRPIASRCAAQ